jgi:hypothetical protein
MNDTQNTNIPENSVSDNWQHPLVRLSAYRYGREDSVFRIAKREGKSRQWIHMNQLPALIPTFDEDGYPTDETLRVISEWPIKSNFAVQDLLNYVKKAWQYNFKIKSGGIGCEKWIYIATNGWSGNEEIVDALQKNRIFWVSCWLESHRGGGFKFLTAPFN